MTWRLSRRTRAVLEVFLADPSTRRHGIELTRAAKVGSGTAYPLLAWLERNQWIDSDWDGGQPRRRVYWMTGIGQRLAREALDQHPEPTTRWARIRRWLW